MMVSDDLNAEFGPYVDKSHVMHGKTPHLDALAKGGSTFMNAYVQIPVCGPSRASFMSGRTPGTTGIYHFEKVRVFFVSTSELFV